MGDIHAAQRQWGVKDCSKMDLTYKLQTREASTKKQANQTVIGKKRNIPFKIASQSERHLGIKTAKDMPDFNGEIYKGIFLFFPITVWFACFLVEASLVCSL